MKLVDNYAKIIFEKTRGDNNIQSSFIELEAIKDAIFFDKKITRFFTSSINKGKKDIILQKIADKYKITPIVTNIVKHMIDSCYLYILPDVVEAYRDLCENRRAIKVFISEKPVKTDEVYIEAILEEKFGSNLNIAYIVDPDIIGGMVVRFGNTLLDASIKGAL